MCKIVKDIQQVVVNVDDEDNTGNKYIVELEAKGYQMFFAPVNVDNKLVYTLTLIEEHSVESYEKIVKETIKKL